MSSPTILLLSLDKESFWDEQYSTFVDAISSKATIKRATKPGSAVTYLTNNTPSAVIITDAALTDPDSKYNSIRENVVNYVRSGGTAVIGTHFSTFVRASDADRWFSESWGVPWENGDYYRTTVRRNAEACGGRFGGRGLPEQYSQKAVLLKNVSRDAAVYLAPDAASPKQTPVAFTKVGNGWLGYVGDVNNEPGSQEVILAMCGL